LNDIIANHLILKDYPSHRYSYVTQDSGNSICLPCWSMCATVAGVTAVSRHSRSTLSTPEALKDLTSTAWLRLCRCWILSSAKVYACSESIGIENLFETPKFVDSPSSTAGI